MALITNEIVYNSGINIWKPGELATLAVFYDKIWLPYVDTSSTPMMVFRQLSGKLKLDVVSIRNASFIDENGRTTSTTRFTNEWCEKYNSLFDEGILCRMAPPTEDPLKEIWELKDWNECFQDIHDLLLSVNYFLVADNGSNERNVYFWQDHVAHLRRVDVTMPAVFILNKMNTKREVAKSVLAESVFSFFLPQLADLEPDDILEIRSATAANREGFSAHLQSLSGALDSMLKSGEKYSDLSYYAKDVVETKLIPDYIEFKRQLIHLKIGKSRKILATIDSLFQISSSPYTPKFWYDFLKVIGGSFSAVSEIRKDDLSNKSQAFNFISSLEERHSIVQRKISK